MTEMTDVDACADQLIQLALRGGAPDNVTVIVADVVDVDQLPDGAAPPTASHVVGAAAIDRGAATRGGQGAAARAAAHAATTRPPAEPLDEDVRRHVAPCGTWSPSSSCCSCSPGSRRGAGSAGGGPSGSTTSACPATRLW